MANLNFEELKQGYAQLQANLKKIAVLDSTSFLSVEETNSLEDWQKRLEQPEFNVLFIGGVSAGKSTMINALLGKTLSRAELKRTTVKATLIKKAQQGPEGAIAFSQDGQKKYFPLEQLDDLVNYGGNNEAIDHVEVMLNDFPFESDTILVDSPGFDTPNQADYKVINEYLSKAHVCVVCFDPVNIETVGYTNLIQYLISNKALLGNKIFWVLNKWNNCTTKQKADAEMAFFHNLIGNQLDIEATRVYRVSSGSYLGEQLQSKLTRSKNEAEMVEIFKKDGLKQVDKQAFEDFRKDLFTYLNETAKNDFKFNATRNLKLLQDKLKDALKRLPEYTNPVEQVLVKEEIKLRKRYVKKVYAEIEVSKRVLTSQFEAQQTTFFKEEAVQRALKQKITESVDALLNQTQLKGTDTAYLNVNIPEIEAQLYNIEYSKILRTFIHTQVNQLVYKQFIFKMTQEIKDKLALDKIDKQLDAITAPHLLDFRIRGFLDAILFNYELDALKRFIPSLPEAEQDKKRIPVVTKEAVVAYFKKNMIDYLNLTMVPITKRVWILTLNCFRDMMNEINRYLEQEDEFVATEVPNEKIGMTGKAKLIQDRVAMIQEVLETMKS